jgi:hypothetical protein
MKLEFLFNVCYLRLSTFCLESLAVAFYFLISMTHKYPFTVCIMFVLIISYSYFLYYSLDGPGKSAIPFTLKGGFALQTSVLAAQVRGFAG